MKPILPVAIVLAAIAAPAAAQSVACDGTLATIRTSTILPGKMASFEKAVADQNAWYAAHPGGSTAKLMRVIRYDTKARRQGYADDEAMTMTLHPGGSAEPQRDAGYSAFVAEFKESSKVKYESRVCMAK